MSFISRPYLNHKSISTFLSQYQIDTKINTIKRDVNDLILNIDSIFRKENTNSNDFVYNLPVTLKNIISYEVNSIELPNVWYTISSYKQNNEFTITVSDYNDGSGNFLTSTHTIKIRDGNYNLDELKTYINNYFTNIKNGLDFIYFDIDSIHLKSIFRVKDLTDGLSPLAYYNSGSNNYYSPNLKFELKFNLLNDIKVLNTENAMYKTRNINRNFGSLLGFEKSEYVIDASNTFINNFNTSSLSTIYYGYLEGETNYGETIDKYIFLVIEDYNNNVNDNFFCSNENLSNTSNIIAKIPINSPSYSIINQTKGDSIFRKKQFYSPVDISKLRIKLINKYGELIELNSNNYSFTIVFKQIYS